MAFVNEKISEKDREYFNFFNFKNPVTGDILFSRKWTIDRKRNAFLVGLGGQGFYESEIPMYYALVWKKNVIVLETFSDGKGSISTGVEKWWKITGIEAPECLINDKNEMLDLIREAFDGLGFAGRRDCVIRVNFDYIAEPRFIREVK